MTKSLIYFFLLGILLSCTRSIPVDSVSVLPSSLSMHIGDTELLRAQVYPQDASDNIISWNSYDNNIATVSDGLVMAISSGTTKIVASAGGKLDYCDVTVVVDVNSISLNTDYLALEKGETAILTATLTPDNATNKTVVWTSSNKEVATVSNNGEVKALSKGKTVITAQVGERYTKCTVSVIVPLKSLEFTDESEFFIDDVETHIIHVTPIPEDATVSQYIWTIDNGDILAFEDSADSSSIKVKAKGNGETTVRVKAKGTDVETSKALNVKVKATSFSVGFMEYSHKNNFYVWRDATYGYETTYNSPLNIAFEYEPEIACVDEVEVEIEDDEIVSLKEDGSDLVAREKSGETRLTFYLPYGGLKTTFQVSVKEFLFDAGVNLMKQGDDYFKISFGGRIYSRVKEDVYYVNNVLFCDNTGLVLAGSVFDRDKIDIFRNGTSDVGFSTVMINVASLYGFRVINKTFYDFLSQCYFYVTFRKASSEEYVSRRLYLDEYNWCANYEYL